MKRVVQILGERMGVVIKVGPSESVLHALEVMARHDVGAVLVMDGDALVGILTERDYARKVALRGKISETTRVCDIMSSRVICGTPHMTLDHAMMLTSERNIRHLPILNDSKDVIGVISSRDLIRELVIEQKFVIEQLEHYIAA
jgi:CBS domain-containing protein